jgi:membrane-bound lytic murein transglycosylase MltF
VSAKPWTGDFDQMLERRVVRILVPYSRTLYYLDKGRERGVTAEIAREWERAINKKYAKRLGKRPLTVYLIPTTRDQLLPGLLEGRGDVAAGNITVTEDRSRIVDFFSPPGMDNIDEVVVAGPKAPPIASADDLSGKRVHVRKVTSYHESLVALNARFAKEGRPQVTLLPLPDALEDEGIWAQILPRIKVISSAVVRNDGRTGWAMRKGSPQLQAELTDFYATAVSKQGLVSYLKVQAMRRVKQIRDNTADEDLRRFEEMLELFTKYGARYQFDPLMLAAQGYQESRLDQSTRSHTGAIGVMQIMPATGKELDVGDVRVTEANIHAGAKYLDQMMAKNFAGAKFSESDRPLFAFASYTAGPANIARMRQIAAQRGLDPDVWFKNVELVTAEKIGVATTNVRPQHLQVLRRVRALEGDRGAQRAAEGADAKGRLDATRSLRGRRRRRGHPHPLIGLVHAVAVEHVLAVRVDDLALHRGPLDVEVQRRLRALRDVHRRGVRHGRIGRVRVRGVRIRVVRVIGIRVGVAPVRVVAEPTTEEEDAAAVVMSAVMVAAALMGASGRAPAAATAPSPATLREGRSDGAGDQHDGCEHRKGSLAHHNHHPTRAGASSGSAARARRPRRCAPANPSTDRS